VTRPGADRAQGMGIPGTETGLMSPAFEHEERQYLPLPLELLVLTPELPELVTLRRGQPIGPEPLVDIGLGRPLPDRVRRGAELPRQCPRASPRPDHLYHPRLNSAECVFFISGHGNTSFTSNPGVSTEPQAAPLHPEHATVRLTGGRLPIKVPLLKQRERFCSTIDSRNSLEAGDDTPGFERQRV